MTDRALHERDLLELTSLPTASGREQRVMAWLRAWAARHPSVSVTSDAFGNLMLSRSALSGETPIILGAHIDHPCFVVTDAIDERTLEAEFRGGVGDRFFEGTRVRLWRAGDATPGPAGRVQRLHQPEGTRQDKWATMTFDEPVTAAPGDLLPWDLGRAEAQGDLVHAPACDDLAGVAAALAAFSMLLDAESDVRVLLTRAEEVGFVGAMAACRSGILPPGSRVIGLETSKSFPESPIAGGPIVRVGDRTSTFDPDLTYRIGKLAETIAADDPAFKFQRKLMPGGTCESSAYQALGFTSTCLCLPLGNYHNMDEVRGVIAREIISLADFHGLVRLLVAVGTRLDQPGKSPPLKARLDQIYAERINLLSDSAVA